MKTQKNTLDFNKSSVTELNDAQLVEVGGGSILTSIIVSVIIAFSVGVSVGYTTAE
jgi:hypothetical protein